MKLTGKFEVKATVAEESILKQLVNGFNYFEKYYRRLCLHYDCINFQRYERLQEFILKSLAHLKIVDTTYDMRLWFVILKDLKVMKNEHNLCVGIKTCLYLEFLTMQISRIDFLIDSIFEQIYHEET